MIRLPYLWRTIEGGRYPIPFYFRFKYKIECLLENAYIRRVALPYFGLNTEKRSLPRIIVSLTTYPARNAATYYAVKSLMLQSVKADKIELWLASSQYPKGIPTIFKPLIDRGLTVKFCDDLRSHKKYFYVLQNQQSDEVVVTFDDDIIYEYDAIEKLIRAHQRFPDCMICNRTQKIVLDDKGMAQYRKWRLYNDVKPNVPTIGLIPSTGAGCLYPYGVVTPNFFDWDTIKGNALTADDLWIGFNCIDSGLRIVKTVSHPATLVNVRSSQNSSLTSVNDVGGENQRVIDRLLTVFPDIVSKIKNAN